MTREEAIKLLKQYQGYEPMSQDGETLKHAFDLTDETVDTLLTALRPVIREQVETVWRGEWNYSHKTKIDGFDVVQCSKCGHEAFAIALYVKDGKFCPKCGAPMTDEAVEMVMERLEALHGDR